MFNSFQNLNSFPGLQECNYKSLFTTLKNLDISNLFEELPSLFNCEIDNTIVYGQTIFNQVKCLIERFAKNEELDVACLLSTTPLNTNIKTFIFWGVLFYLTKRDPTGLIHWLTLIGLSTTQINLLMLIISQAIDQSF